MGVMGVKFFEPPSSSFQGGLHISHQASLLPEERGCNRPTVLFFYLSVSPARRAPHPNQAFPFQKGKGCNRPPVLGTASL